MSDVNRQEESAAVHGARWIAVAFILVGLLNYGYALQLTHLLDVASYSKFAAGQSLMLWAANVATVSVPWVLAQGLARARSTIDRAAAIQFSRIASVGSGLIAAALVGTIAARFAGPVTAITVAASTFLIFLGTATTGYLQGQQRMRVLSILYVGENTLKNVAGLVLVGVAGLGATGALAAFGIGALVMLLWWPRVARGSRAAWRSVMSNRNLWRSTFRIAGMQALISLFVVVDVVLVALLPDSRAMAASYQASAAVSRIALFIAGAVATAFFPSLSRRAVGGMLAARAVQMYMAVALPISAMLATVPAVFLTSVFPGQYGAMASLLKFTAIVGVAAGGISLLTAVFQATDDTSCIPWLCLGLAGYVAALLAGWRTDGIPGLAVGAALGTTGTLALLGYRLVRREGWGLLAGVPLLELIAATAALILLRPYPILWIMAAVLIGLRAGQRFLRPDTPHVRPRFWPLSRRRTRMPRPAGMLLTETIWHGNTLPASELELRRALILARQNRVEGRFAMAYPEQFANVLDDVRGSENLYSRIVAQAVGQLRRFGISAVLFNDNLRSDYFHTTIDLVVSAEQWRDAVIILSTSFKYCGRKQSQDSWRALFEAVDGPAIYIHGGLSWFGVPGFPASRLLARARENRDGILVPVSPDYLRLCVGHALYQEPALDLSALLTLRELLNPSVVRASRKEAMREGWIASFDSTLTAARQAINHLDKGLFFDFQVPLSAPLDPLVGEGSSNDWPESEQTESFYWQEAL